MNSKEYQRQYYLRNKERIKKRDAKRLAENPRVYTPEQREKRRLDVEAWRRKYPTAFKEYYYENHEKEKERSKQYKKREPEKVRAKAKKWVKANPDKINKYNLKQYLKDRDKRIRDACEYIKNNRAAVREREKLQVKKAEGRYLVDLIKHTTGLTCKEIRANKDFMELYQAQLLFKRAINKKSKDGNQKNISNS